tara:strand:+ start:68 stop:1006 length:939 start_codon:yes stop_codon:yes gene_type:complete
MSQRYNWAYDKRQSRQEYLEDRITQMGHDPDQYRMWHAELEALKAQKEKEKWPGQWGDKTTRQQWSKIEYAIGRKLTNATDGQLAHAAQALKKEVKRRAKARKQIREQHLKARIEKLVADGYQPLPKAGKEVRRVITDHKIFPGLEKGRPYENEIKSMVLATNAFQSYQPMRTGVLVAEKITSAGNDAIYVQPKALLCFVINRMQDKIAEEEEARKEVERRQQQLKEWEEKQKARSAQVAKDWYQQMEEKNGKWKRALIAHEAKKNEAQRAKMIEVAMRTQVLLAERKLNRVAVPVEKPAQSPADGEQSDSY